MTPKIELKRGENYMVKLLPRAEIVPADYIGESDGHHFFRVETQSGGETILDGHVCLDGNIMLQDKSGVLTHGGHVPSVPYFSRTSIKPEDRWYVQRIRKLEGAMR